MPARLSEASFLDEESLKNLVDELSPKNGSVLWHGMISKEGSRCFHVVLKQDFDF